MFGLVGGCTAANPAFGDVDDGTGSASTNAETTDKPTSDPTLDSTMDPTRAESSDGGSSTSAETGMTSTGTTQPMTSDDGTDDATSTPTTSTEEGSSEVTGNPSNAVQLFVATIDDGHLSEDGGAALQVGAMLCAEALQDVAADTCVDPPQALIRVAPIPFASPQIVDNLANPVVSLDGEAIATTLEDFLEGAWLVPSLATLAADGFGDLAESSLATGGLSNVDPNCAGWTTNDGDLTIGNVDGGAGWFSAGEISCSTPAHILCVCLQ